MKNILEITPRMNPQDIDAQCEEMRGKLSGFSETEINDALEYMRAEAAFYSSDEWELRPGFVECADFNPHFTFTTVDGGRIEKLYMDPRIGHSERCYGTADSKEDVYKFVEPIFARHPDVDMVCILTGVSKKYEPERGGWRYHKWGPFVSDRELTREYLYDDETAPDTVYVWGIYGRQ